MTPNQMRLELDPLDDAGELLAGAVLGAAVGLAAVGVGDGGAGVGDGGALPVVGAPALGEERMTAPPAAWTHTVARHPATMIAAASSALLSRRRITALPCV